MTVISVPSSRPLEDRKADVLHKVSRALGDADIMTNVEGDLLRAGTMLLGRDMARLAGPATHDEIVGRLRVEVGSQSNCPLAQELTRVTRGNFQRARGLLRDLLSGYESV